MLKPENIPLLSFKDAQEIYRKNGLEVRYLPLLEEIRRCGQEDDFIFLPIWGKNRTGKSSMALWQLYYVYGDWDVALEHVIYTLPDLMQLAYTARMEKREIPLVVGDDIAVHMGKRTKSFDLVFKGFSEMFDAIATLIHAFLVTLIRPDSIVPALRERYFGEVVVGPRGFFNYVSYDWRLAYYLPAQPWFVKVWIESGSFTEIPREIYEKYKVERMRLLDIKLAEVQGLMYDSKMPLPKITEIDKDILKRVSIASTSVRDDALKHTLMGQGYDRQSISMMLAKLESSNLLLKRGVHWFLSPRGKRALEEPSE